MAKKEFAVSVPVYNSRFQRQGREALVESLRALGAKRVFLALEPDCILPPLREKELSLLKENCAFLHEAGFEAGAWLWTFALTKDEGFTRMESPDGKKSTQTVCPADESYREAMGGMIGEIARAGVDLIQFDDDFRYGFQDMGFGCACPLHRRRMEAILGRAVGREELSEKLLGGGPSETRDAFLRANGEILEEFAAAMRRSLDRVSPSTRLGFCSCITSWDLDGTTPDRISRILAGNTRPFYRLIGAPYWAALRAWGNRLGDVLELERSEASRREDGDIEIMSEGDTHPRPRFKTPASYLEIFDTALRAAGCTDGILKYALDYVSSAEYETGYTSAARRHAAAYEEIDRFFGGKTPVGVRVYDKPDKYKTFQIPEHIAGTTEVQNLAFSATSRFLAAGSIPTVYEGRGLAGAAFGDDALCVPEEALSGGMILDVSAAKRLWEKGVDVGVASFGEQFLAKQEFFADGEIVSIPNAARAEALVLKPGAKVLSRSDGTGPDALPLSYTYRNERGGRFLVFAMEGYFGEQDWFRQYTRQRQIDSFLHACGRSLPAFCPGHPELYVLAAEGNGELSVGLWNIFPDRMLSPAVFLDRAYDRAASFGCEAVLEGNVLRLSDIAPYDFAFLRLS